MTDGTVGVLNQTAVTAKKVDVSELTVGSNTVERQRVVLGDNTNNYFATVDASGYLTVNIGGAVSLPTGAATAAKQPALGTAGSASADVITVQGVASMTPLLATAAGDIADAAADSGKPVKVGGIAQTTLPTYSAGQRANFQTDIKGRQFVAAFSPQFTAIDAFQNANTVGATDATGALTSTNLLLVAPMGFNGASWDRLRVDANKSLQVALQTQTDTVMIGGVNVKEINAVTPLMGNGGTGTGSQRVTIASDNTAFNIIAAGNAASAATDSGNPVKIGAVYRATQPTLTDGQRGDLQVDTRSNLTVTLMSYGSVTSAGINFRTADGVSASAGGLEVNAAAYIFNGSTYDRARGVNGAAFVSQRPQTTGGLTPARVITGVGGFIKASAGQAYKIWAMSTNAAVRYLHIYNKASAPTLSTDTPVLSFPLLQNAPQNIDLSNLGTAFATGIAWAYTTDNIAIPATAATSGELQMSVLYN